MTRLRVLAVVVALVGGTYAALDLAFAFTESRIVVDVDALTDDPGRLPPRAYSIRVFRLAGFGPGELRTSTGEPFVAADDRGRIEIAADRARGTELRAQLRYRTWLGFSRTTWLTVDLRDAIARARCLPQVIITDAGVIARDDGTAAELIVEEPTDPRFAVRYSVENGPFVDVPRHTFYVPLARVPQAYTVSVCLPDGRCVVDTTTTSPEGRLARRRECIAIGAAAVD